MPTVREQWQQGIAAGVAPDAMGKRLTELGLTQADLDLEYGQAVQVAKARKAAAGVVGAVSAPAPPADLPQIPMPQQARRGAVLAKPGQEVIDALTAADEPAGPSVGLPDDAMPTAVVDTTKTASTGPYLPRGVPPADRLLRAGAKVGGAVLGLAGSLGNGIGGIEATGDPELDAGGNPIADIAGRAAMEGYTGAEADYDAAKQGGYTEGTLTDLGRLMEAPAAILSAPFRQGPQVNSVGDAFIEGLEGGASVLPGMIGGMGSFAKRVATGDVEALAKRPLTTAMNVVPALKAGKLGVAAKAAEGSRVAQGVVKAGEFLDRLPSQAIERGEAGIRRVAQWPGKSALEARVKRLVDNGALTPDEAATVLQDAAPNLPVEQPGRRFTTTGSGMSKGAAMGAVGLGDVLGPGMGAAIGAIAPEVVEAIVRRVPAEAREVFRRFLLDPAAQADPEMQDAVRRMIDAPNEVGDTWQSRMEEGAGRMERGEVGLDPNGHTASRPAVRSRVLQPNEQGTLVSPQSAVAKRGELTAESERLTGDVQAVNALEGPLAESAARPDQALFADPLGELADARKARDAAIEQAGKRSNDLDVKAGLATVDPRKRVRSQTNNPIFEELIDQAHEAVTAAGGEVPRSWTARAFTDTLLPDTLSLPRSYRARGKVYNLAADELGIPKGRRRATFMRELDDKLVKIAEEALGDDPVSIVLASGPKGDLTLADLTAKLTKAVPAEELNQYRAQAMRKVAIAHKQKLQEAVFGRVVRNESNRFDVPTPGVVDPALQVNHMLQRVEAGEPFPMFIKKTEGAPMDWSPETVAREILGDPTGFAQRTGAPIDKVMEFADRLLHDFEIADKRISDLANVKGGLWVRKGPHASLKGTAEMLHWSGQMQRFEREWEILVKKNLTSRSLPAHLNNAMGNIGLLTVVDGIDPFTGAARVAAATRELMDAGKGIARDAETLRKWRDGRDAGLRGTTMLEAEVGTIGKGQGQPPPTFLGSQKLGDLAGKSQTLSNVRTGLHHVGAAADNVYQLGDLGFKAERYSRFYDSAMADVQGLESGRGVRYQTASGRVASVEKAADGSMLLDGKPATMDQVSKEIAKAAMRKANDLFIDYRNSPLVHAQLRKRMQMLGAASPFFHWFFGAVDLPGKPGFLSHALAENGSLAVWSNSPKILSKQADASFQLAMRRAALNAGLQAQIDKDPEGMAQSMVGYPQAQRAMMVLPAADPSLAWVKSWSQGSFAPSDAVIRMGLGTAAWVDSLVNGDELWDPKRPVDKDTRIRRDLFTKLKTGQIVNAKMVMQVAGASGGLAFNTFRKLQSGDSPAAAILTDFARMFIGGTTGQILVGLPTDTGRKVLQTEDGPTVDEATGYVIRQIAGVGFQQAFIEGQSRKYLRNIERELADSLGIATREQMAILDTQLRAAEDQGDAQYVAEIQQQIEKLSGDADQYGRILERVMDEEEQKVVRYEKLIRQQSVATKPAQP